MTIAANNENGRRGTGPLRILLWGGAAALLALPAVAMQFDTGVAWTAFDFGFAAVLIAGAGLLAELIVRRTRNLFYRGGAACAVAAALMTVVATGAVGMIGNEGDSYNLLFLGVVALAVAGAAAARFRARGMAVAMGAAAAAQLAVSVGGMASDPRGALFSAAFAGLWLLSAGLFAKAARDRG